MVLIPGFLCAVRPMTLAQAVHKSGNPSPMAILVMCANDGHLGLLLNFACGLKHKKISMPIHLIFVATTKLRDKLAKLGFTVSTGC